MAFGVPPLRVFGVGVVLFPFFGLLFLACLNEDWERRYDTDNEVEGQRHLCLILHINVSQYNFLPAILFRSLFTSAIEQIHQIIYNS